MEPMCLRTAVIRHGSSCTQSTLIQKGMRMYVVTAGSTDGSPEKISQHFPDVTLIALKENIGVPAGFNQGIQVALNAGYEYVFILNNDTVVAPDMLLELIKVAEKDENFSMAFIKTMMLLMAVLNLYPLLRSSVTFLIVT